MARAGRTIRWIAFNAAFAALAWLGVVEDVEWAANLFRFAAWVMLIATFLVVTMPDSRQQMRDRGPSAPVWLSITVDVAVSCLLAAHGWFFYATIVLVQGIAGSAVFSAPRPKAGADD